MINIHDAKTNLSRLLQEVSEEGKEIVIAKAGKPIARLVPYKPTRPKRKLGLLKGQIWIAEDFDAPLSDAEMDLFEGSEEK